MNTHTLHYGTTTIQYQLAFTRRKTLGITVRPDCSVQVVAPVGSSLEAVEAKLKPRCAWIVKQQREFERYLPTLPARQYVSGETHLYLGKQYRLKVEASPDRAIKLSRGRFFIATPEPANTAGVKAQLDAWYRAKAETIFAHQLTACLKQVAIIGITGTPELRIRTMQKRWGSCSTAGVITLNRKLIQVPKLLIDYVIIHELCHLKEHNHSAAYYHLLDRAMPQWRERREALNQVKVA